MSLNCNEIDLALKELDLNGSFIQDIIQPGFDTICLYTYGKNGAKTILICTAQNVCRIHETRRKIVKNEKPLRFMEFLKSRIKGFRIVSCSQIEKNRIIKMELVGTSSEEKFILYIRLWNNAANVILCDVENNILDSMFRRPGKDEKTGGKFEIPKNNEQKTECVWPIRDFEDIIGVEQGKNLSFNEKLDLFYSEYAQNLSLKSLLEQAEKSYNQSKIKMENSLENLLNKQSEYKNAQSLKHQGDLILANIQNFYSEKEKFAKKSDCGHNRTSNLFEVVDYETGKTVSLVVDFSKTPHENAANYYENYKKAQNGLESMQFDIEHAKKNLEKLEKWYAQILLEKNPIKVEQLLRKQNTPKQKQKKTHPGLNYIINDWYILVGRDVNENDELLRHHVRGSDMWLHVRDFHGGYVFIKNRPGKTVPLDILLDAATLAVHYSKARNNYKTDLYYTYVKYLRRAKNAPKGTVLPTHEKNLCVVFDKSRFERLENFRQS